jgi:aspartyl-tRNA(Asn)/glutamyl-tRNA(Gln) amidotransferase subunit A
MSDLCSLSATQIAAAIAAKTISPVEVVQAMLDRIDMWQPHVNAFITVAADDAMAAARAAEEAVNRGESLGPLHGVPFSVKDLLNTAGVRTTFGSLAFENNVPPEDCVSVARLKAAGAIMVGKTTTPEFGHKPMTEAPLFGRTVNPWNPSRTSGGSSGGAAAAVASGQGPLAIGTDGGGSTRIPAACCGVVGMKQTLGLVPHDQSPDTFGLLSYIGPIARNVEDAALMLSVMSGPDDRDVHSLGRDAGDLAAAGRAKGDLRGLRVSWREFLGNDHIDTETQTLFRDALRVFEDLGAALTNIDGDFPNTLPIWGPLTFSIWASRFAEHEAAIGDRMTDTLRHWMDEGRTFGAVAVQDAMAARTTVFRAVQDWFGDADLVVMPTLSRPAIDAAHDPREPITIHNAPVGGPRDAWYPYTHPFNLSGHPAITVPCGWTADGLPVALQIIGPWLGDAAVLRAAALFEAARPWAHRQPKIGDFR